MSDPTAAERPKLSPYGGRDVITSGIVAPNMAGGLRKAFSVDRLELPIGSKGAMVLEFEVTGHQHKEVKDTEALELVNVVLVTGAAMIERETVAEVLDLQKERSEQAAGITRLPYSEDGDDAADVDDDGPADPPVDEG